jgi:hypothetical protein
VTVIAETSGQVVSGTASNSDNASTASVVVKLDRTAPVLSSVSPADGSTTQSGTTTVSATVVDALSGLSTTRCNGAVTSATPSFECVVGLSYGRNSVTLSALDAAGNSASVGIRMLRTGTRTRLVVSPSSRTLTMGQRVSVVASDEYGKTVTTVTWVSSDPSVGTVTADTGRFTALAAGQTTLTASDGVLSAAMSVTVLGTAFGEPLPPGTTEWILPPSQLNSTVLKVLPAKRVDQDSPDLFVLEQDASAANFIRGVTAEGTQLWAEAISIDLTSSPAVFADAFGGLVISVSGLGSGGGAGLARVAGPSSAPSWRYESPATYVVAAAQAPDGTIYAHEVTVRDDHGNYDMAIVAIDGSNGLARFRVPLPNGIGGDPVQAIGPTSSHIAIASDGTAYAQIGHYNEILTETRRKGDEYVDLLTLQSDGTTSWRSLEHVEFDVLRSVGRGSVSPGAIIDDGLGAVLLSTQTIEGNGVTRASIVRLADGVETRPAAAQGSDSLALVMSGDDGTVLRHETTPDFTEWITALDGVSGTTKWRVPTRAWPIALLPDGAALLYDHGSRILSHVNPTGTVVGTQLLGLIDPLHTHDDAFVGTTPDGRIAKITTASFVDRTVAPSASGQRATNLPVIHTFAPVQNYGATPPFTPTDVSTKMRAAVRPANATAVTRLVGEATLDPFISVVGPLVDYPGFASAMKERAATVVGLIAHSVDIQETTPTGVRDFSVGVQLFDQDLIKQQSPPEQGGPQWLNLNRCLSNPNLPVQSEDCVTYARTFARWVDKIYSHAKVIVLATCFVGEEILSLFDVTLNTKDKMLIVPENPSLMTDLVYAAQFGWPTIANELSLGHTVGEAIKKANQCLPVNDNGTPANPTDDTWVPDGTFRGPCSPNRVTWKRIGGSDGMRIRPPVR